MEPEDLTQFELPEPTTVGATTQPPPHRRTICSNCTRPLTVCLCATLPTHPIPTTTQIIILHHPHGHNNLSTVPILTKSLLNTTTLISRRLRPGLSPLLDSLHSQPTTTTQYPRAIYLFPPTHSHPSVNISNLNSLYPSTERGSNLVLIVFDGTWRHAKEMVSASLGFLSKFAIRVCLDCDERVSGGSIYDSELILKKEPFGGCVSTMEAVARALRVIEPNGVEIERRLVEVLREMVRLQKRYLKPVKPRPKLLKKGKREEKMENENVEFSGMEWDFKFELFLGIDF
ncbi:hypothetical protein L1049_008772 [Liquidambar formosana]|uniref:tRNA-uridine aminocarboxypropyltransferase n=1 Tax=Liquidambar formosana TaxID=63359 RepID=A0AAP0S3I4_LIQFO